MRRFLLLAALVLVAAPLGAQKRVKHDPDKISTEELAEYGDAAMIEVIPKARPKYLMPNGGGSKMLMEQTVSGMPSPIVVFVGTMQQGDSSVLRFYKASDVKEVRYYKPGNSMSPRTAGDSFVIQLVLKDRLREKQ